MVIVAGPVIVAERDRDALVAAFDDLVERCRKAEGCLDVAISPDSSNPCRINMIERWESQEALDAWRAAANAPQPDIAFDADGVLLDDVTGSRPAFAWHRN